MPTAEIKLLASFHPRPFLTRNSIRNLRKKSWRCTISGPIIFKVKICALLYWTVGLKKGLICLMWNMSISLSRRWRSRTWNRPSVALHGRAGKKAWILSRMWAGLYSSIIIILRYRLKSKMSMKWQTPAYYNIPKRMRSCFSGRTNWKMRRSCIAALIKLWQIWPSNCINWRQFYR